MYVKTFDLNSITNKCRVGRIDSPRLIIHIWKLLRCSIYTNINIRSGVATHKDKIPPECDCSMFEVIVATATVAHWPHNILLINPRYGLGMSQRYKIAYPKPLQFISSVYSV